LQIPIYSNNVATIKQSLQNNQHNKYYLEYLALQFTKDQSKNLEDYEDLDDVNCDGLFKQSYVHKCLDESNITLPIINQFIGLVKSSI